jgi:hypothetical protein
VAKPLTRPPSAAGRINNLPEAGGQGNQPAAQRSRTVGEARIDCSFRTDFGGWMKAEAEEFERSG